MTPEEKLIEATFNLMKSHASLAGQILLEMQPHIHNFGKKGDSIHEGEHDAGGTYKTVMDDLLQEAFLARLLGANPFARVNAEEETPLLEIFRGNDGKVCSVHQDPLDGTKSYVRQNPEFALGFAISQLNNLFPYSVVGIPARKMIYAASPAGAEIYEVGGGPAKKDIAELIGRICELQEMAKRKEAWCIFGGDSEINTLSRKIVSEINFLRPAPELKEASGYLLRAYLTKGYPLMKYMAKGYPPR
ncbi:hypothetical protein HYU14_04375 [Candidatus Woesearchaeota archaeon]|nr:hypothetical protein [Candidatus Woesearchaeota archaeon]